MTNPHLTGPWQAVLADSDGDTYPTFEDALDDLGADFESEMTVSVVRGSAAPVVEGNRRRLPGTVSVKDRAYEIEVWLVDPDDAGIGAEARFVQAQAMAAGLNAAAREKADA